MKLSKRQLKKIILRSLNESEDARSKALDAAMASIRSKFGQDAILDTGAGDKLSNDWMKFVSRQSQRYHTPLLQAWDEMVAGRNPLETREAYFSQLGRDSGIAGAISFYGKRIRQGQQYLSGAEIKEKIDAKRQSNLARDREALDRRQAQIARLEGLSLEDLKAQRKQFIESLEQVSSDTSYPYGRNRGDVRSVTSYQKPGGTAFTQDEIQMLEDFDLLDARQHGGYAALAGTTSSSLSSDALTLTITYRKHTAG